MWIRFLSLSLAALATVLFVDLPTAEACGGFFCSFGSPVNQKAERIIFSQNGDGTVTAIIEIRYSGPSESFAWVIPVEGDPNIAVSSSQVFQTLQLVTDPQYNLQRRVEGECDQNMYWGGGLDFANPSAPGAAADAGAAPPAVNVVNAGSVGPYDWITISVDPEAADIGSVAVDWLQDNGYDVDNSGRRTLTPYLSMGMNLVAFRLTKNTDAGAIRPISITFRTERPGIPILPTAVAAEDDMGVMVWVLGEHRAIPQNYLHVHLNEALINWFNWRVSYDDIVSAAANEAGGQGFVTEMALPTDELPELISDEQANLTRFRTSTTPSDLDWLLEVAGSFRGWDGVREVLETVPWPEGYTLDMINSCPFCYSEELAEIEGFDRNLFLDAFDEQIIQPLQDADELLHSRPKVTRLYTTMSAHEMTLDPLFDFNPDLPDVSNVHTADMVVECHAGVVEWEAPWRIELADGSVVRGMGQLNGWPLGTDDISLPAASRIERLETSGEPRVLEDNTGEVANALDAYNRNVITQIRARTRSGATSGGGCAVGGGSGAPLGLLLALGLLGWRRRRH